MKTVVVIGGGITGMSAMYELHKWKLENRSDVKLVLIEASDELGGKIRTRKSNGFIMETGADSIVSRKIINNSLVKELGLENETVYNATGRSFIYTEGELKPIPEDSIFGIPASIESLAKSTLVSAEGKVEALKDFYTKNETFTINDSIGDFLDYFLGKEIVEKQIAPVLSGVYSGNIHDLTISSTLPYLLKYKNEYGSIINGLSNNKKDFQSGSDKKFLSYQGGLQSLVEIIERKLEDVQILKNNGVKGIEKNKPLYQILLQDESTVEADHIILSIPNEEAKKLLTDAELKEDFDQLKSSSLISIYLGFDLPDHVLPLEGTGFITANSGQVQCDACTWTSRKWEHTSQTGNLLLRLFYKSSNPAYTRLQDMAEEELLKVAVSDVRKSIGIEATPVSHIVTKWSDSMPNYTISHPHIMNSLESKLAKVYPGIEIAGCSYYGVGIPDCIENGVNTAKKIITSLS